MRSRVARSAFFHSRAISLPCLSVFKMAPRLRVSFQDFCKCESFPCMPLAAHCLRLCPSALRCSFPVVCVHLPLVVRSFSTRAHSTGCSCLRTRDRSTSRSRTRDYLSRLCLLASYSFSCTSLHCIHILSTLSLRSPGNVPRLNTVGISPRGGHTFASNCRASQSSYKIAHVGSNSRAEMQSSSSTVTPCALEPQIFAGDSAMRPSSVTHMCRFPVSFYAAAFPQPQTCAFP